LAQNDIISNQKQAIEQVNNQLEMKLLQAQMSPHFMANSLRAVQELVKQGQGPKALEYVNGLELFSEMLLHNAENPTTPIANEIKLLNQYLSLEKIRSTDAFDFNIMSDESPEIMQASLPSFIIRPFVEKALEQVTATENKGFLHLQFTRRGNQLVVKLQHSGNTSPLVDDLLQTRLNVLKRQGKTVEINTLPLKNLQGHSTGIQQEIILPLDW
jgi:LytS/YehU family sensor histidine kinase